MANMYTDLERSIFNHLTVGLAIEGLTKDTCPVTNMPDDTVMPSMHQRLQFAKVYDLPNDDAPRGPGSQILTPVVGVSGNTESYNRQDWPEGYKVNYKITSNSESIETIRKMENTVRRVFRPKHPVYLYDADTNALTDNYCDISYRGYLNQDNVDLGFYSRAIILQFEVYDYNPTTVSIPAIQSTGIAIEVASDPIPGVDIVISQ